MTGNDVENQIIFQALNAFSHDKFNSILKLIKVWNIFSFLKDLEYNRISTFKSIITLLSTGLNSVAFFSYWVFKKSQI